MPLYVPESDARGDVVVDPRDQGFLTWTFDPATSATTGSALSTGVQYINKVWIPRTMTITNIHFVVSTVGATLTAGGNNLALYDSAGNRIAATVDQTTNYTTTGFRTVAFSSTVTVAGGPGVWIWAGMKSSGTTPVAVIRSAPSANMLNANLSVSVVRGGSNGTSAGTLMPATITPGSNAAMTTHQWLALS